MPLFNQQKLVRGLLCFPSKARPPEGPGSLGTHLLGEPSRPGGPSAAPRPPRPQALSSRAPSWGLSPLRGPARPRDPGADGRLSLDRRTEGRSHQSQGRSGNDGLAESSGPPGPLGSVPRSGRLAPSVHPGRWWQTPSRLQMGPLCPPSFLAPSSPFLGFHFRSFPAENE